MRSFAVLAAMTLGAATLVAQDNAVKPPPIKLGLWEKTIETTTVSGNSTTNVTRSCVTASSWQRMVNNSQKPRDNCKIDSSKSGDSYTFSATGSMPRGGSMAISGSAKVDDPEHISSDTQSTVTMSGQKLVSKTHADSRYIGANCGAVRPDESPER